jgi:hypothetical protein
MKKILFLLCSILLLCSCNKDEAEPQVTDPEQVILGRWELIEDSFGPVDANGYDEYQTDSIKISYNYDDGVYYNEKYWFEDSLLIRSFTYIDPYNNDTVVFKWPYRFEFISSNTMKLDFQFPSINTLYIYTRIK